MRTILHADHSWVTIPVIHNRDEAGLSEYASV